MKASTSTPSTDFLSREITFTEALKALAANQKSHMIALCGMGGVGKTTMMQRLRKVVQEKKMFNFIIEAVIGERTDPIAIQEAIADYLGVELNEKTKPARADKLRQGFKAKSDGGKNKFLVILDDVWHGVDLEDIGLSPFPNQGVDFKVLLTSRDNHVCTIMGVAANSILNVGLLIEEEAQSLFRQFVETSDPELHKIGEDIVRKCCGLPIAIKTIACTLRNKRKDAWNDALSRLEHHDIHNVAPKIFETSYKSLPDEETKSIFLMCGLFSEDFDIPTEELVRYGWGLKLFDRVYTIREARNRLNTCIERLMQTNLLIKGGIGCVKMHDLVRAFVLDMLSKVEHASIVNHGSMLVWPEDDDIRGSCKRISLTCRSMSEFPRDLKFPNLSILKLMHGDKSLRFPQNFYEEMEKLRVISYDKMKYPLLPSSPQCSVSLRVLHLHQCSLMFDCSSIGNMLNLEVLSFVNSGIEWLPAAIGNLKKLKLLDLTDCDSLRIDTGVLKNLVKLEEFYMRVPDRRITVSISDVIERVSGLHRKTLGFTDDNCKEMAERSKNLSTLEFEFFKNNVQPKDMSFEKLLRFKISVGCYFNGDFDKSGNSFENTLQLVANKDDVLESRMNDLFEKTEVLFLSVGDIVDLEDIEMKSLHLPQSSSFYNLRVLVVSGCVELRYLFTLAVANTLSKLEHLQVCECDNMEELIHTDDDGSGEETVMFPKLKFLSLRGIPKLSGLCRNVNIIELPQLVEMELYDIPGFTSIYPKNKLETPSLFKEEVVIPKLEILHINHMEDLEEIWPDEFGTSDEANVSMLRMIEVVNCGSLRNLFPCNPMPFIQHLEELQVLNCGSIDVLFDIDLDSIGDIGEGANSSSLRRIQVEELGKLRNLWRIKGENNSRLLICGFQAVESVSIKQCKWFRNVFTPITANFDLKGLMEIFIKDCGENEGINESTDYSQEQTDIILSKKETPQVIDIISKAFYPSSLTNSVHNLRKIELSSYEVEVLFEIESPRSKELVKSHDNQQRLLPYLEDLNISHMERISQVWKCNWHKLLFHQKEPSEFPFQMLTTIHVNHCKSIKCLFSPLMAKFLTNLKTLKIENCEGIEEVISNIDDENEDEEKTIRTSPTTNTTLFPHLDSLTLFHMKNLKCIGGGAKDVNDEISFKNIATTTTFLDEFKVSQAGGVSWTLCQYSRKICIWNCRALSSVIPSYAAGQMHKLQVLEIEDCHGINEVFETQEMNNKKSGCDEGNGGTPPIPGLNNVIMLPNLKIVYIRDCGRLEDVFPFSALESLRQLEELTIKNCWAMKVIMKEEHDGEQITASKVVVFPRLKSIALVNLPNLVGFFMGKNEFRWPSLDKVIIKKCPQMIVFAPGGSTTPKLKYIHTSLGTHNLECGLNFQVTTAAYLQTPFQSSGLATLEAMPWSFHNLIKLDVDGNTSFEKIIPSNELLKLQKLEEIHVSICLGVEEVFEALERTNSCFDESQTTLVKLSNLRLVNLEYLQRPRYIWKSNQWTVFEFPNLTKISINQCQGLEHVFTRSMVRSLLQIQELHIRDCYSMVEVIVEDPNVVIEEEKDGKMKEITLPFLKSVTLDIMPRLKGFCLGKEDFSLPLLDTLRIEICPAITTFTKGNLATPKLKEIETRFGSFYVAGEDINSFIKIKQEEFERCYY